MKTFELSPLPSGNKALSEVMLQKFIYTTRWKLFQNYTPVDHIVFHSNHELTVVDHGNETFGRWHQKTNNEFILEFHGTPCLYLLRFADPNLLVFQNKETKRCLILTATSTHDELYLNTLQGVESYMFNTTRSSILPIGLAYASIVHGKDSAENDFDDCDTDNAENDDYQDDWNDQDDEEFGEYFDDDEFDNYGDLTKEEIIYDYLQQEEQDEDMDI